MTAFLEKMSESSDFDNPRERGAGVRSENEHLPMAVVKVISRPT